MGVKYRPARDERVVLAKARKPLPIKPTPRNIKVWRRKNGLPPKKLEDLVID